MQAGRPLLGETMQVDQSFVPRYTKHITITSSVLPKTQIRCTPVFPLALAKYMSIRTRPLIVLWGCEPFHLLLSGTKSAARQTFVIQNPCCTNVAQIRPRTPLAPMAYKGGKLSQLLLMSSLHNGYITFLIFRWQIYSPPHAPLWRRLFLIYYFGKSLLFSCLLK